MRPSRIRNSSLAESASGERSDDRGCVRLAPRKKCIGRAAVAAGIDTLDEFVEGLGREKCIVLHNPSSALGIVSTGNAARLRTRWKARRRSESLRASIIMRVGAIERGDYSAFSAKKEGCVRCF